MKGQFIVAASFSIALLYAGDFWQEKEFSQWNDGDVQKMLAKSPWAKSVVPEMAGARGGMPPSMGRGGAAMGGGASDPADEELSSRGRRGSGGGAAGGAMMSAPSLPPVTVRWESAEPVRNAEGRTKFPPEVLAEINRVAAQYYILSLTGVQNRPSRRGGPGGPEAQANSEQGAAAAPQFRSISIQRKGKDPVMPEKALSVSTPDGPVVIMLFNRKDEITNADNEVTFEANTGMMSIKTKFKLKDMNYRGKLEL
jgi:hypothetical protein